MKGIYRFLLLPSFLLLIFLPFVSPANAQTSYSPINSYLPQTDPGIPQNTHTLVQGLFIDVLSTFYCYLTGVDPATQNHQCLGPNIKTGKLGYMPANNGAMGFVISLIGNSYNLPIHANDYFNYLSLKFHPFGTPKTYAQGIGTQGLHPLMQLWIASRNIAYLFIVIIFLVVGIGIMLRIKIDPRTVMTIQNTIPRIIIGLLLITFSYAIIGLLIDMTYVVTFLLLNLIANAVGDPASFVDTLYKSSNPYSAVNTALTNVGGGLMGPIWGASQLIGHLVNEAINSNILGQAFQVFPIIILFGIIESVICVISNILGAGAGCNLNPLANGTEFLVSVIIMIALLIAVFLALFRFWIGLVNCYISILFAIILGPLRLLLGMVPGSPGGGVGGWFRDLIGNLLVFPISLAFIMIIGEFAKIPTVGNLPLSNAPLGQSIAAAPTDIFMFSMLPGFGIGQMVALVAILAILPKLPSIIPEEMFKSKNVFGPQFGTALGGGIKTITKGAGATIATLAPTPRMGEKGGPWVGLQRLLG